MSLPFLVLILLFIWFSEVENTLVLKERFILPLNGEILNLDEANDLSSS